ncbi:MAG: Hsp70 family protein [Alphaproteobacteria bacterium]|nr:Hsp70 family protein [Alphaproteobacteria bacterium]
MQEKILAGIDFGTSNSLIAIATSEEKINPVQLYQEKAVIPTTLFFGEKESFYGSPAIDLYLSGETGRFMRGIKSLLGSETEREGTRVFNRFYSFSKIIKEFLYHLKKDAEIKINASIEDVVLGRPVHFHENQKEDIAAERCLEKIAKELGFKNISFQYEPLAAALHYEQTIEKEELTLVADLGGGTSDFSVIRLAPNRALKDDRTSDILSNDSVHTAGMDLDRDTAYLIAMPYFGKNGLRKNTLPIPYSYFNDVCEWHLIQKLYTPTHELNTERMLQEVQNPELFIRYVEMITKQLGHYMLFETERAKIDLSSKDETRMNLNEIEKGFFIPISKEDFLSATHKACHQIIHKAQETIDEAGITGDQIQNIIFTGGTSLVPSISKGIRALCPVAEVKNISTYAAVGSGLALEAWRRYGA